MNRFREIIYVTIAALFLLVGYMAIAVIDRPHGDIGTGYGPDQVKVNIGSIEGSIEVPQLPEGLLIFGAGQNASMEFAVTNEDPDNDVDTVIVTIPGSEILNGSYAWYEMGAVHEWNLSFPATDVAAFEADTDYAGINHGGSAQYDTAGGEDDALDHNANVSEGITLIVEFRAPSTPGLKTGIDSINLEVADLKTENANPKVSIAPFPYPYIVGENGDGYIVMILEGANAGLGVSYDGQLQFDASRASGFKVFEHGMEYSTDDGKTVAVLEQPSARTIVKPIILPSAGSIGGFSLTIFNFTINDVTTGQVGTEPVVSGYTETPQNLTRNWDLDIDSDGIFNALDPDIDGDTYANAEDPAPYDPAVFNTPPSGATANVDKASVEEGTAFTLSAAATDPDTTVLTYSWTCDEVPSWTQTGKIVIVRADGSFVPGTYTFTVTVSDGISSRTTTDDITLTITEKPDASVDGISPGILIAIIAVVVVIIVILVYFFIVRGREEEDEEQPLEMGPEPAAPMEAPTMEAAVASVDIADGSEETEAESTATIQAVRAPSPPASPEAPSNEDSEDVQELEQLIEDLEKTEEEISDLCPECGSPLGSTDTSCSSCGTEFELALECPNCGSVVEDKSSNCPSCGIQFI